jgi:hypothetical protein
MKDVNSLRQEVSCCSREAETALRPSHPPTATASCPDLTISIHERLELHHRFIQELTYTSVNYLVIEIRKLCMSATEAGHEVQMTGSVDHEDLS